MVVTVLLHGSERWNPRKEDETVSGRDELTEENQRSEVEVEEKK